MLTLEAKKGGKKKAAAPKPADKPGNKTQPAKKKAGKKK